jgi:hypothetical protein
MTPNMRVVLVSSTSATLEGSSAESMGHRQLRKLTQRYGTARFLSNGTSETPYAFLVVSFALFNHCAALPDLRVLGDGACDHSIDRHIGTDIAIL